MGCCECQLMTSLTQGLLQKSRNSYYKKQNDYYEKTEVVVKF